MNEWYIIIIIIQQVRHSAMGDDLNWEGWLPFWEIINKINGMGRDAGCYRKTEFLLHFSISRTYCVSALGVIYSKNSHAYSDMGRGKGNKVVGAYCERECAAFLTKLEVID